MFKTRFEISGNIDKNTKDRYFKVKDMFNEVKVYGENEYVYVDDFKIELRDFKFRNDFEEYFEDKIKEIYGEDIADELMYAIDYFHLRDYCNIDTIVIEDIVFTSTDGNIIFNLNKDGIFYENKNYNYGYNLSADQIFDICRSYSETGIHELYATISKEVYYTSKKFVTKDEEQLFELSDVIRYICYRIHHIKW